MKGKAHSVASLKGRDAVDLPWFGAVVFCVVGIVLFYVNFRNVETKGRT